MDETLLFYLKDFSAEVVVISFLVFGLTMLIKWPIKKVTAKLAENKRKALNTIIVLIPMCLSLLLNVLYSGIFKHVWFGGSVFQSVGSCYIMSIVFYAVCSRLIIVIKGLKTDKASAQQLKQQTSSATEVVGHLAEKLQPIAESLGVDNTKLHQVAEQIDSLLQARAEILSNIAYKGVVSTKEIDDKLAELNNQKQQLQQSIGQAGSTMHASGEGTQSDTIK